MSIHSITADELNRRMKLGHNVVLIDIRTPLEFESGHIPGAISYPFESFIPQTLIHKVSVPFPELPTLHVVCANGTKSGKACQSLADHGYPYLIMLEGGMYSWAAANLPMKPATPPTLPSPPQQSIDFEQQKRIVVGVAITLGTLLGTFWNTGFLAIAFLAGVSYIYEGVWGTDYLKDILERMPWNQPQ